MSETSCISVMLLGYSAQVNKEFNVILERYTCTAYSFSPLSSIRCFRRHLQPETFSAVLAEDFISSAPESSGSSSNKENSIFGRDI